MHKSQRRDVIPVVEVGKRPRATQRSRATTSDTRASSTTSLSPTLLDTTHCSGPAPTSTGRRALHARRSSALTIAHNHLPRTVRLLEPCLRDRPTLPDGPSRHGPLLRRGRRRGRSHPQRGDPERVPTHWMTWSTKLSRMLYNKDNVVSKCVCFIFYKLHIYPPAWKSMTPSKFL
jgi:hypothetical protein